MSDFALVRQPVFGGTGSLIGYEIRFRDSDGPGSFTQSVLSGTFDLIRNRMPAFVAATREQILSDAFLVGEPGAVIIMLPPSLTKDDATSEAVQRLAEAGASLALDDVGADPVPAEVWLPQCTWVRVDARSGDAAAINTMCAVPARTARGSWRRTSKSSISTRPPSNVGSTDFRARSSVAPSRSPRPTSRRAPSPPFGSWGSRATRRLPMASSKT
jgi:hypothetical protein